MAILDHDTRSSRLRRSFIPAAGAAILALTLASAHPSARRISVSVPPTGTAAPAAVSSEPQARADASCWIGGSDRDSFSGYTNTDERGTILERVGRMNGAMIIQQRFGDTRLCMRAEGSESLEGNDTPTARAGRAPHVIIASSRAGSTAQYEVRRAGGTPQTTSWRVNGADRPFDAAAQAWRDAVLAVLDRSWEISTLRGEESSLRGDISSLRGDESSLRGDISSIRGDISSLQGDISSVRGDESSLRGDISSIHGQLSSLEGDISSERGTISSLEGARYGLSEQDRASVARQVDEHRAAIKRIEREIAAFDAPSKIAAVEKQLRDLNADKKVAAIEAQIRAYGEHEKIAAIEKQIEALKVDDKTAEIERRIASLDVERRTTQLEKRQEEALRRLEQALAAIK